jgi:hypothetical protein
MFIIARRLTILTLVMVIFAISFAALATYPVRRHLGVHMGTNAPCYHPATADCIATL